MTSNKLLVSQIIEDIKSRVSIVSYIQDEYGIVMAQSGNGQYSTHCIMPGHLDNDPSFTANDEKGLFKCWSCGASGDIVTLVMRVEGLPFRSTIHKLAAYAGVPIGDDGDNAMLDLSVRAIVRSLNDYLTGDNDEEILPAGMSFNEFCYAFADRVRLYERETGDTELSDSIYRELDGLIDIGNLEECARLWKRLAKLMKDRRQEMNFGQS